jgi:transcriptional regulator with XRE-family HTH domain
MAIEPDHFSARLRAARCYAGLTQNQLADKIGVDRKTVIDVEKGRPRDSLSPSAMQRLAEVCDVPVAFLVAGWEAPPALREAVRRLSLRVDQLEREVSLGKAERDAAAQAIYEIAALLEDQQRTAAAQALERILPRPQREGRRKGDKR